MKSKSNYQIVDSDNNVYPLYIVSDYEVSSIRSIIIKESATGNGGVTYDNGRLQESIPINGTLYGDSKDDLELKQQQLKKIQDKGMTIEFITPLKTILRSNKYYIQELRFTITEGINSACKFSMTITENRQSNVKDVKVNLVNYETANLYVDYYNETQGNI